MMRLFVVGIGPAGEEYLSPQARNVLSIGTDFFGYAPYLERIKTLCSGTLHASDNRAELARAQHAIEFAMQGHVPVIVSGGDPGVFGMASALFEAIEEGPSSWRRVEVSVIPGISAVFAASARIGAPLGNDFAVISLSDNLKPWSIICRRLVAAAEAEFVIALYNARSQARGEQLKQAFSILRGRISGETPIIFARAIGRADESVHVTTLTNAQAEMADMRTLIIIGAPSTRLITRADAQPWVYTPRSIE